MREHLQTAFLLIVVLLLVVGVGKALVTRVPDLIVTFITPSVIAVVRAMGFDKSCKLEEKAMALDLGIYICGALVVGFIIGAVGMKLYELEYGRGQGADLLENRGWDVLSDRVVEASYSASKSFLTASS